MEELILLFEDIIIAYTDNSKGTYKPLALASYCHFYKINRCHLKNCNNMIYSYMSYSYGIQNIYMYSYQSTIKLTKLVIEKF